MNLPYTMTPEMVADGRKGSQAEDPLSLPLRRDGHGEVAGSAKRLEDRGQDSEDEVMDFTCDRHRRVDPGGAMTGSYRADCPNPKTSPPGLSRRDDDWQLRRGA